MRDDVDALVEGVRAGHRAHIARAITLVESAKRERREAARELLTELASFDLPPATRVGISGVPGVGKSTFIEALGTRLSAAGHRVGVLADLTARFAKAGISLSAVRQEESGDEAHLIVVTHAALEEDLRAIVEQLSGHDDVLAVNSVIRLDS